MMGCWRSRDPWDKSVKLNHVRGYAIGMSPTGWVDISFNSCHALEGKGPEQALLSRKKDLSSKPPDGRQGDSEGAQRAQQAEAWEQKRQLEPKWPTGVCASAPIKPLL